MEQTDSQARAATLSKGTIEPHWVWVKIKPLGDRRFSPCFHLLRLHFGYLLLIHIHMKERKTKEDCGSIVPSATTLSFVLRLLLLCAPASCICFFVRRQVLGCMAVTRWPCYSPNPPLRIQIAHFKKQAVFASMSFRNPVRSPSTGQRVQYPESTRHRKTADGTASIWAFTGISSSSEAMVPSFPVYRSACRSIGRPRNRTARRTRNRSRPPNLLLPFKGHPQKKGPL